jgi:SAM-dependent methyltransferase
VPSPLGRAVEIGCGEGRVTRELKAQGYDVLAFDVSETLVELAREADPAGEYAVADAAALPIANGVAQLVIAFNVLNELAQLRETVAPLADYMAALAAARLLVEALREVPTVIRAPGRLPAYLHLRAVKR